MTSGNTPTLAQFVPDDLEYCASPTGRRGANSPATLDSKSRIFRLHLLPAFGSLHLDQLQRRDVDRYIIEKTKANRDYKSIIMDVEYLRHLLRVAKRYDLIAQVPELPVLREPSSDVIALDPDEAQRFSSACEELPHLRDQVLLELYLRTGLRAGEAVASYPADFDLEAEDPTVRVLRTYGKGRYGPPKGRKSRVVPVVPSLAAKIDELLAQQKLSPRSSTAHVFTALRGAGRPLSHSRVFQLVQRTGEAAETRKVHPHMLRHTFGTECARRGVPLLTIKEWMGHGQVGVTMKYLHLVAPDHLRWAKLLSE
jgi:integrase